MKSKIPCEPGPGAVDEAGPCDGALRRNAGAQPAVPARLAEPAEIGEQAGAHQALRQTGIHAVEADHDHFLSAACRDPLSSAEPHAPAPSPAAPAAAATADRRNIALRLYLRADVTREHLHPS